MKFAANVTLLFSELPMMERFGAAWAAGFTGVEVLFPYDEPVPTFVDRLSRNDLEMVLMNCPPPNYTGGERGFAAVPASKPRFQQDFRRALRFAKALNTRHIHIMAGVAAGAEAHATFVENLSWAAGFAPDQSLTIEPLNQQDMPGYFLSDFHKAKEIVVEVGAKNLGLQFDTYHAAQTHGDVMAVWAAVKDVVRHIQLGQAPDRSEPGPGQIDFDSFFAQVAADGYGGWLSAEYHPSKQTQDTLGWLPR
jgi:hydroxypyruvate isomerase